MGVTTRLIGVERVWDYPRPPVVEPVKRRVRVQLAGELLADVDARAAGAGDQSPTDDLPTTPGRPFGVA